MRRQGGRPHSYDEILSRCLCVWYKATYSCVLDFNLDWLGLALHCIACYDVAAAAGDSPESITIGEKNKNLTLFTTTNEKVRLLLSFLRRSLFIRTPRVAVVVTYETPPSLKSRAVQHAAASENCHHHLRCPSIVCVLWCCALAEARPAFSV